MNQDHSNPTGGSAQPTPSPIVDHGGSAVPAMDAAYISWLESPEFVEWICTLPELSPIVANRTRGGERRPRSTRRARKSAGSGDDPDPEPSPPEGQSQPQADDASPSGTIEILPRLIVALEAIELADYLLAEAVLHDLEDDLRSAA